MNKIPNLKKQDIIDVIEGKGAANRVPINYHFWVHPEEFGEKKQAVHNILDKYPEDFRVVSLKKPSVFKHNGHDGEFSWLPYKDPDKNANVGLDNKVALKDWDDIDFNTLSLPDITKLKNLYQNKIIADDRYLLAHWWYGFFETHWSIRGMTNCMMDYYLYPEKVHALYRLIANHFKRCIKIVKQDFDPDGIFITDDLGTQNSQFFSSETFDEFFYPYYKEIIDYAHGLGMHFWLHSCGNITEFIPKFIDIGLDVLHPIQKYTMGEKVIANTYGDKICIWAGFDVQQIIPWGTVEEVKKEVRFMFDNYYRTDGRFMLTAGNGVNRDCPLDSLKALFEESVTYKK